MWIGKDEQGLVFLEEDWKSDRLPEDLVEEAGLLGTDFKILSKIERAKLAGYACYEKEIRFTVDPVLISKKPENLQVYLAWAGNQWMDNYESKERWLLKYDKENLLSLNCPSSEFPIENKFEFKFITSKVFVDQFLGSHNQVCCWRTLRGRDRAAVIKSSSSAASWKSKISGNLQTAARHADGGSA